MPKKPDNFPILYSILAALILIRFLPFVIGTQLFWGIGHLTFLPFGYVLMYSLLAAVALILPFMPQAEKWGRTASDWFNDRFLESRSKYLFCALFLLLAGVVFTLFRMPTHFLGDGYTYISDLGSRTGNWVRWSERGAMSTVLTIESLLGLHGEGPVETIYQILSILSGLVSIWFYFLIARVISADRLVRLLTFLVLAFSPAILLFFGYVESYPLMMAPLMGALYFGLKYAKTGRGLIAALLLLLVATGVHLQVLIFYPGFLFLALCRGRGEQIFKSYKPVIIAALVLVAGAGSYLVIARINADLAFRNIFLPLFVGKPTYPGYASLSTRHFFDIANLFLLVSPAALLILIIGLPGWKKPFADRTTIYLGLLSVGSLLFLMLVDPGLSMPRDWDLFSTCCLAPTLLILHLLPEKSTVSLKRLTVSITMFLILAMGSYLLVNLDTGRSIVETKQIIKDNREKSFGTLSILRFWYAKNGDQQSADSLEVIRQANYPDFFKLKAVYTALKSGELIDAETKLKAVVADPYSKDFHQVSAELYLRKKMYDSALVHADAVVQLQPYYEQGYITLSSAYYLRQEPEKAIATLRRGLALNRESVPLTIGMTANFASQHQVDSTLIYAHQAVALDSTAAQPYYFLALAYDTLGQASQALESARKYLALGQMNPDYAGYQNLLLQKFPELKAEQPEEADTTNSPEQ